MPSRLICRYYPSTATISPSRDPTVCPQLEEIFNRNYPSCWSRFIQMMYLRNASALLPVDSRRLRRISTPSPAHSVFVAQLSTAMSSESPSSRFRVPSFCWPHRPLLKSARPRRGTTPCFMCHNARVLETGYLHQRSHGHFTTAIGGLDPLYLRVC